MKEAIEFLDNLFKINDTIVLAISGGPDSMCLLDLCNNLKDKYNLNIICAHVNHGLRKESEQEKEFVEDYCNKKNIIFEYYKIEDYKNNKFTEEEGRRKRYSFFDNICKKYKAKYLLTAHHGDDLIETILMRIVRGSTIKGYIGIPKITSNKNYKIVRPLLYVTKEDILDYLNKNNIPFVVDYTNDNEKYTRNRYRKRMLPLLKEEDKNVHLKFLEYSIELEKNNNYINIIVDNKYKSIVNNNIINIELLLKEDKFIQERIIRKLIENIQKDYIFNINKEQFNGIMELLKKKNCIYNLADGFVARRSYNNLYIEKDIIENKYNYIMKEDLIINNKYTFKFIKDNTSNSNYIIRLNSKEIKLPLIVRSREDGDKIKIKNLNGSKKIKDIFIDCKMDNRKRDGYPIVTDSNNIVLWVPGIKKSIFDKEKNEKYDIIIKYVEEEYE